MSNAGRAVQDSRSQRAALNGRKMAPVLISAVAVQASSVRLTHAGTVRICFPLPIESAITQCSSRIWKSSTLSATSSAGRKPHPTRIARIARSRLLRRSSACVCFSRAFVSSPLNQLPILTPNLFREVRGQASARIESPAADVVCATRYSNAYSGPGGPPHRPPHTRSPAQRAARGASALESKIS
jgi:hypothetical protein